MEGTFRVGVKGCTDPAANRGVEGMFIGVEGILPSSPAGVDGRTGVDGIRP